MNFHRFWDALRRTTDAELESSAEKLINGICDNMPDYRERVGYIRGIKYVLAEARHIMGENESPKRQQTEDEDDG